MNTQDDLLKETNAKKALAEKDFDLLSKPGIVGDYKECELTHIYLIEKDTNNLLHYYAVLSYEEYLEQKCKEKYLTETPIVINKRYKLGIQQTRISLNESRDVFTLLCQNKLAIDNTIFSLPQKFTIFPKTHIPSLWGYESALLSKILKPNFFGNNYIIEYFSNQYPFQKILNEKDINKINVEIKEIINIDLNSVIDRIGSFIFQFPITLVQANAKPSDDWCNAELSVKTYSPFFQKNNITSIIRTNFDDVITGYNTFDGICHDQKIDLGDSRDFELIITNRENKLIYHHSKGNFIRNINFGGNIGTHNSEPRTFKTSDSGEVSVDLFHNTFSAGRESTSDYSERIQKRIRYNELLKMNNQFKLFNEQRQEALIYVRELIESHSGESSEIWMLDPYLQSQDILDTLYYLNLYDVKLKCITSYKKSRLLSNPSDKPNTIISCLKKLMFRFSKKNRKNKDRYLFEKYKIEQKKYILDNSNNLGISLDFRITHDNTGFDFHDRFLFFLPKEIDSLPIVYSLGTSVNSLGKSHHIIQRLPDPRKLVATFEDLWNILTDKTDCIIKLPEDIQNEK
ncbi:hypothetical protein AGMMS49928_22480 [Spirochaetia bacterium]|nr:hypothetical protein AGMMS49928_22480 [Spirochaetia bacterium]